jgi:hypothetical protein
MGERDHEALGNFTDAPYSDAWFNRRVMQTGASTESIDPVIECFCAKLAQIDYFTAWRDELAALAPRVAGTKTTDALADNRGWSCCDWAVRTIAPAAFDFWARVTEDHADADRARAWADRTRALLPIDNDEKARAAARVVQGALADVETASDAPPIDGSIGKDPMWGLRSPGWQAADAVCFVAQNACNACYFSSSTSRADYAAKSVAGAGSAAYALVTDRFVDDWTAAKVLLSDASRPFVEPWWRNLWDESLAQLTRLIEMTEAGA